MTSQDIGLEVVHLADRLQAGANGKHTHRDTPPPAAPAVERPAIDATDQRLERISQAVWDALGAANDPPRLFTFAAWPSRIIRLDDGSPAIQALNEDRLSNEAARAVSFFKPSEKNGPKDAAPPMRVIRDMLACPDYPLPRLVGVTEAPTFAADGTLRTEAGYHPAGRTYYTPAADFALPTIPATPSRAEIDAARTLLLEELLGDFPFIGDAERAHTLALILLPFVRNLIGGPTPLHLIEKPTAGTGASLLAEIAGMLATGRPVGAMTEGRDEDEWRKRLTAKLRGGSPIVLIDNIRRRLDSAVLSSALTATVIEDRLLGTSDSLRIPVRCAWVASGNNPALSSEISRRAVRIRVDAKVDRPWLRTGFRHEPLLPWVHEHRASLAAACLTIGCAWLVAGRPAAGVAPLGSYEAWTQVMGGILATADVPGFLANRMEFYEASDTEGVGIRSFLAAWWKTHTGAAVGVADLFPIATSDGSALDLGDKGERSQKIRLGKLLSELRDRHYAITEQLTVNVAPAGTEKRAQLWRIIPSAGECQRATFTATSTEKTDSAAPESECSECQ